MSTDLGAKPATASEVSTDSAPARAPSASACEIYREVITEALVRGRNAMAIWQDLFDDHGFTARYASVRRFVRGLRDTPTGEARVVITTVPGEEAQVDYGEGPMVRDPATGKYKRTRLFVLTLGYSRKAVRLLVWRIADADGKAATEYVVVLFPSDPPLWKWQSRRIQQTRPSNDGKFTFKNLPAGDYLLGAVTEVEQYQWYEPAFLTELSAASVSLTLAEGEKKRQDLRIK